MQNPYEERGILSLSWGSEEELLVGSKSLRLFQTADSESIIWRSSLSTPTKIACFSPDAGLMVSCGLYDRLLKLWRRLSFGADDTRFDFTYLPHPATVTAVHWRKSHDEEHILDNLLYSICADNKVRIWAATDPHRLQVLQLWAEIDMQESLQPRQVFPTDQPGGRYAFVIDGSDFNLAVERVVKADSDRNDEESQALEHLIEVQKRNPEVCVVLDGRGNMSAWGLESVGCKARKPAKIFNIAHMENLNIPNTQDSEPKGNQLHFLNFCGHKSSSAITLLVHYFDGRIAWLESKIDELFDPSRRQDRFCTKAVWTGHDGHIKKIVRSGSGKALLSRTNDNEGLIWRQESYKTGVTLTRSSSLNCPEHIHRTCLLEEGFVVNLHHHSISLWNTQSHNAFQVASSSFDVEGKLLCLLLLREPHQESGLIHVAAITSRMTGIVWEIQLGRSSPQHTKSRTEPTKIITEFCSFDMGLQEDLIFVLPVDPAGSPSITSSFLDTFAKDLALSYTSTGALCAWAAVIDLENSSVNWLVTSTVETGIDFPSLASGSSIRKTAVVDSFKTGLTIWDVSSGQLEYDVRYEPLDLIQDLDWSSTPDDQSILAVGFPHKVVILSQMRFDYISTGPAWAPIRQIYLRESTPHPIGDSTWLGSGDLVVGSGNQLYIYDKSLNNSDEVIADISVPVHSHQPMTIFDLVTYLNGPLPVFHPQFLAQCLLAGKVILVQRIIINLHRALKFFTTGDELDIFVSISITEFYSEQQVSSVVGIYLPRL